MTITMSLKTCKQFLNITLKPKNSKCSKVKREYRVAAYKLAFNFIIRKSNPELYLKNQKNNMLLPNRDTSEIDR